MFARMRSTWKALLRRSVWEDNLEEELKSHVEFRVEDLVRSGLARQKAERQARIELGGRESYKEQCRAACGLRLFDELRADFRYAARVLRNRPAFIAAAVLALGIGIGVNTAVFSVVHAVLLRPLPYREPGRLVRIYETSKRGRSMVSPANFLDWVEQTQSWKYLASTGYSEATLTGGSEPEMVRGAAVSRSLFATLGVKPLLGQAFGTGKRGAAAEVPVMLSYRLWQRRFGSDPNVIGTDVAAGDQRWRIAGVAPAGFWFCPLATPRRSIRCRRCAANRTAAASPLPKR